VPYPNFYANLTVKKHGVRLMGICPSIVKILNCMLDPQLAVCPGYIT